MAASDCDAVVAVAITPIVAHLAQHKPTVFISDATFFAMADYNWQFQRLIPGLKKSAHDELIYVVPTPVAEEVKEIITAEIGKPPT